MVHRIESLSEVKKYPITKNCNFVCNLLLSYGQSEMTKLAALKPQFWDISLEGCRTQKISGNNTTKNHKEKCLFQKISYNEPNLFHYADNTTITELHI